MNITRKEHDERHFMFCFVIKNKNKKKKKKYKWNLVKFILRNYLKLKIYPFSAIRILSWVTLDIKVNEIGEVCLFPDIYVIIDLSSTFNIYRKIREIVRSVPKSRTNTPVRGPSNRKRHSSVSESVVSAISGAGSLTTGLTTVLWRIN